MVDPVIGNIEVVNGLHRIPVDVFIGYCVGCYPRKENSKYIYCGNSYCEECFKAEKEYRRREEDEA